MDRHQSRSTDGPTGTRQADERGHVAEALPRTGLWVIAESGGSFVTYDDLKDTVNAIYGRAQVTRPPKPIHCLRHSFGTVMGKRVPLPVLQTLMGHADVKTTLRYIDVDEQDKRQAIALVFGGPASHAQADSATRKAAVPK